MMARESMEGKCKGSDFSDASNLWEASVSNLTEACSVMWVCDACWAIYTYTHTCLYEHIKIITF